MKRNRSGLTDIRRRTCPACSRRVNQQVAPDCPICSGAGFLILGRPALLAYPVEVVSEAVEYALEMQAQDDLARTPVDLHEARTNLTRMVVKLARSGLLASGTNAAAGEPIDVDPVGLAMDRVEQARRLAQACSELEYKPGMAATLNAPPFDYDIRNVPVGGSLPGFSVAGFICGIARVTDPPDVLRVHTPGEPTRDAMTRKGRVLGAAVRER